MAHTLLEPDVELEEVRLVGPEAADQRLDEPLLDGAHLAFLQLVVKYQLLNCRGTFVWRE